MSCSKLDEGGLPEKVCRGAQSERAEHIIENQRAKGGQGGDVQITNGLVPSKELALHLKGREKPGKNFRQRVG